MPAWIGWGAGLLAGNAGLINAVGFIGFSHEAISHISGVTALLALSYSGFVKLRLPFLGGRG